MSTQHSPLSQTTISNPKSQHLSEDKGSKNNIRQLLGAFGLFCRDLLNYSLRVADHGSSEEDIGYDECYGDRRVDWTPMRKIPDETLCEFVIDRYDPIYRKHICCSQVEWRTSGSYNYAICVSVHLHDKLEYFVIRIPGQGKPSSWTAEDAHNLRCEVGTMEYVKDYTDVPIPMIIDHSTRCDNSLGVPFIMMESIKGESAYDLWHGAGIDEELEWKNADKPSREIEEKRINFLKSLAHNISSLQDLAFNQIGFPKRYTSFVDDVVPLNAGAFYEFTSEEPHQPTEIPAFSTSRDYIQYGMLQCFGFPPEDEAQNEPLKCGLRKVMEIVFSQAAFKPDGSNELFTLHHNDLDLHNIIIDNEGNINGFIDWYGAFAAPQCIGAACLPLFLRKDWSPKYRNCLASSPYMAWNSEHYRQIYSEFLYNFSACKENVQFTTKSAIYRAAIEALSHYDEAMIFVSKLFREIPGLRVDTYHVLRGLASGWPACEEMLECEIGKLLEPEWPKRVMQQVAEAERTEAGSTNHNYRAC